MTTPEPLDADLITPFPREATSDEQSAIARRCGLLLHVSNGKRAWRHSLAVVSGQQALAETGGPMLT